MTESDIRIDAPLYLARYREHEAARADRSDDSPDETLPLYLRRFRAHDAAAPAHQHDTPLWQRASLEVQRALTEDNRNKEIAAPPDAVPTLANDVFLIRHGETQGYSTDSGLTPQGVWQAHTYGLTMAKRFKSGELVVFRHADTSRARETAEHIHRGFIDGLAQFEKEIEIREPEPMDEFRNFQFVSPTGLKDVTAAYREYYATARAVRAGRHRRPPALVGRDGPLLEAAGGGWRPDREVAHHADDALRTAVDDRPSLLGRHRHGSATSSPAPA